MYLIYQRYPIQLTGHPANEYIQDYPRLFATDGD